MLLREGSVLINYIGKEGDNAFGGKAAVFPDFSGMVACASQPNFHS